ncbi:MAG: polysaccharide deacetylase [Lachnospiraceae bacterium]|nr:polysaccharide deacetylase [Lachnospiraceae bacterium]
MSVNQNDKNSSRERTDRVRRLKKLILILAAVIIVIPIILCVILFCKFQSLEDQIHQLQESKVVKEEQERKESAKVTSQPSLSSNLLQVHGDGSETERQDYEKDTRRKVYLTFDDGPSANTAEILDILKEYHVKATFFVVGKTDQASIDNYRRIVKEGHTLGMHSYSHKYNEIYASKQAYIDDLTKLKDYLYEVTGVTPRYVRFPGGSSNQVSNVDMRELIDYLDENDIIYFDWNISSGDTDASKVGVNRIVNNCMKKLEDFSDEAMILLHDANDKGTTVEALPIMIEQIQDMDDTVLLPISEDTIPIRHVRK